MNVKSGLAVLAMATALGAGAAPAAAEPFNFLDSLIPRAQAYDDLPDGAYVMDEDDYYRYLKRKRQRRRAIEESYYDPDYDDVREPDIRRPARPVRKRVEKARPKIVAKPQPEKVKPRVAAIAKFKKVEPARPKPLAKAQPAEATASTSPASGSGMSCAKATQIVSGYGFDSVSPKACSGKVYAFSALRGGKSYLVRLDAASGELTEVKKTP